MFERVRVHFIGTEKSPNDPIGQNVLPPAARLGFSGISEHPQRVPYADVLSHLARLNETMLSLCVVPAILWSSGFGKGGRAPARVSVKCGAGAFHIAQQILIN